MKKHISLSLLLIGFAIQHSKAQVGVINNNPNKDAALDLNSTDGTATKGLLLAKVALTATDNPSPLSAHILGMHVYNTAALGSGTTQVKPGEYYNDGSKWIRISDTAWSTLGNAGTNSTTDALGTQNSSDLVLRTNNTERMRINTAGNVLVGSTTVPTGGANTKLSINNGTTAGAIQIKDGTEGKYKILTADAQGVTSWTNRSRPFTHQGSGFQDVNKVPMGTPPGSSGGSLLVTSQPIIIDAAGNYLLSMYYAFVADDFTLPRIITNWKDYVACYIQILKNGAIVDEVQYYGIYSEDQNDGGGNYLENIPFVIPNCNKGDEITIRFLPMNISALPAGIIDNWQTRYCMMSLNKM